MTLSNLSSSLKTLATGIILTLLLGYAISILQVYDRSHHFDMKKTIQYYRGDELGEESIMLPQTFSSLLSVAHVHSLSQPFIFACLGFIFAFSSMSEKNKARFIALGFVGITLSNLTPWLIRYVAGWFVFLFPLSQVMVCISLMILSFVSLKEIWCSK